MQKLQKLKLGLSELHIIQGEVASQADGGEGDDEDLVFEEEAYYYNWPFWWGCPKFFNDLNTKPANVWNCTTNLNNLNACAFQSFDKEL